MTDQASELSISTLDSEREANALLTARADAAEAKLAEMRERIEASLDLIDNAGNILGASRGCDRKRCPCDLHRDLTEYMLATARGAKSFREILASIGDK